MDTLDQIHAYEVKINELRGLLPKYVKFYQSCDNSGNHYIADITFDITQTDFWRFDFIEKSLTDLEVGQYIHAKNAVVVRIK